MRSICTIALALSCALPAGAADAPSAVPVTIHVSFDSADAGPVRLPQVDFAASPAAAHIDLSGVVTEVAQTARPPRAFVYSDGYQTRNKIHHMASYTMLPLFVAEAYLGQHMFNNPSSITPGMQTAHRAMGWGVAGLFGVNTVTGLWNMAEGRKDPNGLGRRMVHATLMLVADAGFAATAFTRPNSTTPDGLAIYTDKKNQHLALAYASVSVATVGYLIMLFR
jgi:hypothetical protein